MSSCGCPLLTRRQGGAPAVIITATSRTELTQTGARTWDTGDAIRHPVHPSDLVRCARAPGPPPPPRPAMDLSARRSVEPPQLLLSHAVELFCDAEARPSLPAGGCSGSGAPMALRDVAPDACPPPSSLALPPNGSRCPDNPRPRRTAKATRETITWLERGFAAGGLPAVCVLCARGRRAQGPPPFAVERPASSNGSAAKPARPPPSTTQHGGVRPGGRRHLLHGHGVRTFVAAGLVRAERASGAARTCAGGRHHPPARVAGPRARAR